MKNTFHQPVTWDKHQHNYIVTSSQYLITKILSKTYVEHFVVKTQTLQGEIFLYYLCLSQMVNVNNIYISNYGEDVQNK